LGSEEILRDIREARRPTPIAWEGLLETILDQYRQHVDDLSHAVQKDAVQNSADARDPDAPSLRVTFELAEDVKAPIFIIQDSGTVGLTGKIPRPGELERDLPEEERWTRFEGLAFLRKNPRALGARGQGKFIFVGISGEKMIVYDTLRKDGVYRIGARHLGDLSQPLEGKEAIDKLHEYLPTLPPLREVGTRIVIVRPKKELVHALKSGKFERYIKTTWWRLLEDPRVEILLKHGSGPVRVQIPDDLVLPRGDSRDAKVWIREWDPVRAGRRRHYIRKLHLCWVRKPLADDIKGVAVLRGGMVVERIPISDLAALPPQISDHIYGFVEGDDGVDFLLKKIEDPTHYKFSRLGWGKNMFAQVKSYVSRELQLFAREKLGVERPERARSLFHVVRKFNRILKALDIYPFEVRITEPIGPPGAPPKPIDLVFSKPELPRPYPRVDFGETVRIRVAVANRTKHQASVKVRVHSEQNQILREEMRDEDIAIGSGERRELPLLEVTISREKYIEGECKIMGLLNCLEHPDFEKGTDLDKSTCRLWIQQDPPPGKGIFRDIDQVKDIPSRLGDREVRLQYRVEPHLEGGCVLKVNMGHPAYEKRCLTTDETDRYIFELMAQATPPVLAEQGGEPFDVDDPDEILRRSIALTSAILEKYYS